MATTPAPRGHEIFNFGRLFLGHHYYCIYILSLSDLCTGGKKKIFKRNNAFHNTKLLPMWSAWKNKNSYQQYCLHIN